MGSEPQFDSEFIAERYDITAAPVHYSNEEAHAWCAGWNAAVDEAIRRGLIVTDDDDEI